MTSFSENKFGLPQLPELNQFAHGKNSEHDERAEAAAAAAEFAALAGDSPLRVNELGEVEPTSPGFIDPGPAWYQPLNNLDPQDLLRFHAFALAADARPEEVEALAVSLWEDAGWAAPNLLRLHDRAYAAGPFVLPRKIGQAAGFSAARTQLYLIDCPETRVPVDPQAPVIGTPDAYTRAFPEAIPVGLEAEICHGLLRVARRLGGEVRFAPSGVCVTPDPDSAITMTLYSPQLLSAAALAQEASRQLSDVQVVESGAPAKQGEIPAGAATEFQHPLPNRLNQDFRGIRAAAAAEMDSSERAQLHAAADAFDAQQLLYGSDTPGYIVSGKLPAGQLLQVTVEPALTLPVALRWEHWAEGDVYRYTLSWVNQWRYGETGNITRKKRILRLQVADAIERFTANLQKIAAGAVLDEDGFLVDLQTQI